MKNIIIYSILLALNLIVGVANIVAGYVHCNIFNLVIGCICLFTGGTLAELLFIKIMFYKLKKKEK